MDGQKWLKTNRNEKDDSLICTTWVVKYLKCVCLLYAHRVEPETHKGFGFWLNLRHNVQFCHFLASYPGQFALSGRWRHIRNCRGRLGTRLSRVDSRKRIKMIVWTRIDWCEFNDNENALGAGHYLSPGGWGAGRGGGFGAKTRWNLADPLFEFYFTEVIPPNNVWCLSRSPPMSSFSKQIWVVSSESFQSFQRPPLFGSQQEPIKLVLSSQLIPPFVLLQIKWSPLKYPAPPPPAPGDK